MIGRADWDSQYLPVPSLEVATVVQHPQTGVMVTVGHISFIKLFVFPSPTPVKTDSDA